MRIGYIPPGAAHPAKHGYLLREDEARFADRYDLRDLEYDRWHWPEADGREHDLELLDRYDLRVACVGLWGANYLDPEAGADAEAQLDRALSYAVATEAPVFVTGTKVPDDLDPASDRAWELGIDYYTDLVERVTDLGMTAAFYAGHGHGLLQDVPAIRRFLEAIPDATLKFDPANLAVLGIDPDAILAEFNDRVGHYHVKDCLLVDGEELDQPPAGMGDVNWGRQVELLSLGGYDGVLSLEPHGEHWGHRADPARRRDGIRIAQEHVAQFLRPRDRPAHLR